MIWKKCTLYTEVLDHENVDELGNPAKTRKTAWTGQVRFTPWDNQQLALENREVTKNEQLYAVPVSFRTIRRCKWALLDGVLHSVNIITEMGPRWTVIQVKVYKHP